MRPVIRTKIDRRKRDDDDDDARASRSAEPKTYARHAYAIGARNRSARHWISRTW